MLIAAEYLLDPQAIIVGGAWPQPMIEALLARLSAKLPPLRSPLMPTAAPLLRAELGPDAVARGVATLPLHELLAPFPTSVAGSTDRRRRPHEHPLAATR